jgi:hypothetical protein
MDPNDPGYGENEVYLKDYNPSKYNAHVRYINDRQKQAQNNQIASSIGSSVDRYLAIKSNGKYAGNIASVAAPKYIPKIKKAAAGLALAGGLGLALGGKKFLKKAAIGTAAVGAVAMGAKYLYNKHKNKKAQQQSQVQQVPSAQQMPSQPQQTVNYQQNESDRSYSSFDWLHSTYKIDDRDLIKDYKNRAKLEIERQKRAKEGPLYNLYKNKKLDKLGIGGYNHGFVSEDVMIDNDGNIVHSFDKRINKPRVGLAAAGIGAAGLATYLLYRKLKRDRLIKNKRSNLD